MFQHIPSTNHMSIPDFRFSMIPEYDKQLSFGEKFTIFDGINTDLHLERHRQVTALNTLPRKIQFSTMIYCGYGHLSIKSGIKSFEMHEGDLVIIPVGCIISGLEFSEDCRIAVIIHNSSTPSLHELPEMSMAFVGKITKGVVMLNIPLDIRSEFTGSIGAVGRWLMRDNFSMLPQVIDGHIRVIMAIIIDSFKTAEDKSSRESQPKMFFQKFVSLVIEHYKEERSIKFYADRLCITPKYLGRIVKEVSGQSALDLINSYVILEAKVLLKDNSHAVNHIADELNFPNASFFTRYFRQQTGLTPSAYRRAVLQSV